MIALVEGEIYNIFKTMNEEYFKCLNKGKSVALEENISPCSICAKTFWAENLIKVSDECVCEKCYAKYKRG